MHPATLVGCGLLVAIAGLALRSPSPPFQTPTAISGPQDPAAGHLVLVVEGTVATLAITHAVAKADPWAGVPEGLTSAFALCLLGDGDRELTRVPLDLSLFDTDPAAIGKPVRVAGCEVRNSRIALLV